MNKYKSCPICGKSISALSPTTIKDHEIKLDADSFWLYSSNFSNYWWCYDVESNEKIELIYKDYLARIKTTENNLDFDVYYDDKLTLDDKEGKDNDSDTTEFVPFIVEDSKDRVDFTQNDDSNIVINNTDCLKKKELLSYIIDIGTSNYRIDFDTMSQINMYDPSKTRLIKRVEVDKSINDVFSYLKNSMNVLGVAGIKF